MEKEFIFDSPISRQIVEARQAVLRSVLSGLLESLGLQTALDVGCGVGYFSQFLHEMGLRVVALDGREENVEEARRRAPAVRFLCADVEDRGVQKLGFFDVIVCFGLLYHLENPFQAIRNLYHLTEKILIVESMCAPDKLPVLSLQVEPDVENQSLNNIAFYPSESCLIKMLYQAGFPFVYRFSQLPDHEDFRPRIGRRRARTMLAASRVSLSSPWLVLTEEPMNPQDLWVTPTARLASKLTRFLSRPWPEKVAVLRHRLARPIRLAADRVASTKQGRGQVSRLAPVVAAKASIGPYPGWFLGIGMDRKGLLRGLRREVWSRAATPFIISWLDDLRVCVSAPDQSLKSLFLTGYYDPNEFMLLSKVLKPGMTFIDVGANLGLYTLFAARKVGPEGVVLALEPSSREFRKLCANVELNKLPNVRSFQVGASDSASEAELLVALEERAGHNTLGAFGYDTALCRKEVVRLERLDDIVRREGLQRVDVLKMDIEGAEWLALRGAAETLQRFRPVLFLEFSDRMLKHQSCNSGQIWEFLADLGYSVCAFDERTGLPVPAIRKPSYDGENLVAFHPMRVELWPSGAFASNEGNSNVSVSGSGPAEKSEVEQISR